MDLKNCKDLADIIKKIADKHLKNNDITACKQNPNSQTVLRKYFNKDQEKQNYYITCSYKSGFNIMADISITKDNYYEINVIGISPHNYVDFKYHFTFYGDSSDEIDEYDYNVLVFELGILALL